jgi:hypothetical protein
MKSLLDATSSMPNTAVYKQGDGFTTEFEGTTEVQKDIVPRPKYLTWRQVTQSAPET